MAEEYRRSKTQPSFAERVEQSLRGIASKKTAAKKTAKKTAKKATKKSTKPVEDFDSESGPEGEAIYDYGLSDARQAERDLARSTRRSLRRANRRARRQAPAPTLDELREAADPDMRDMMGTEADSVPVEPAPTLDELREAADPDMRDMMGTEADTKPAKPQVDVNELFEVTHGTSFDPNSSMDRRKMDQIKKMLEEMGGSLGNMTPNQFALQIYRNS